MGVASFDFIKRIVFFANRYLVMQQIFNRFSRFKSRDLRFIRRLSSQCGHSTSNAFNGDIFVSNISVNVQVYHG